MYNNTFYVTTKKSVFQEGFDKSKGPSIQYFSYCISRHYKHIYF